MVSKVRLVVLVCQDVQVLKASVVRSEMKDLRAIKECLAWKANLATEVNEATQVLMVCRDDMARKVKPERSENLGFLVFQARRVSLAMLDLTDLLVLPDSQVIIIFCFYFFPSILIK